MGNQFFYKEHFKSGIYIVNDLLLHLNNIESYNEVSHKINKANFLTWTSLRHAIPSNLKTLQCYFSIGDPSFTCGNTIFDIRKNKSKDYYTLIISGKARLPNNAQKLKYESALTEEELKRVFSLPHTAASEPYVKAFQFI